jgi:hypothetical protein
MTGEPGNVPGLLAHSVFPAPHPRPSVRWITRVAAIVIASGPSVTLAEAAIKAQEGNVRNWIEYYERERASRAERVHAPRENGVPDTTTTAPTRVEPVTGKNPAK